GGAVSGGVGALVGCAVTGGGLGGSETAEVGAAGGAFGKSAGTVGRADGGGGWTATTRSGGGGPFVGCRRDGAGRRRRTFPRRRSPWARPRPPTRPCSE